MKNKEKKHQLLLNFDNIISINVDINASINTKIGPIKIIILKNETKNPAIDSSNDFPYYTS